MKSSVKFFLLGLLSLSLLSSCGDDDDDNNNGGSNNPPAPANFLKIGTEDFKFGSAFMIDYGTNDDWHEGRNYDLNLITDGITVIFDNDGFPDSATGSGYLVYLEFFSPDTTQMAAGIYTVDTSYQAETIGSAEVYEIINGDEGNEEYDFTGSVEVIRDGSKFRFRSSNGRGNNQVDIRFDYEINNIQIIDDSAWKGKRSLKP